MKNIVLKTDLGQKYTYDKYNGKFLGESDYDQVIRVQENTAIYKPNMRVDGKHEPLAYVITNAYDDNDEIRNTLASIEDSSRMRANCSGPIDPSEMKAKGLIEGVDYKLRTPNSYLTKKKNGEWGMIAYANEINSVMIGYKRGRFTGEIGASGWCNDNPEKFETLSKISYWNEKAFATADPETYGKQKGFAETFIEKRYRVGGGSFTTLSANRYHSGQSARMSAHVDSGDTEMGLTTMCVFRSGEYDGAFLTFPRYGVAIDAPDNSVVIADSLQIHGVTPITGKGERFSCVAYCDNRLATLGSRARTPKPIGKYAKPNTLEEFF